MIWITDVRVVAANGLGNGYPLSRLLDPLHFARAIDIPPIPPPPIVLMLATRDFQQFNSSVGERECG